MPRDDKGKPLPRLEVVTPAAPMAPDPRGGVAALVYPYAPAELERMNNRAAEPAKDAEFAIEQVQAALSHDTPDRPPSGGR